MKTQFLRRVFPALRRSLLLSALAVIGLGTAPSASAVEAVPLVDSTLQNDDLLGTKPTLRINNDQTILLQFWLASLPNGAYIEKATLRLWVADVILPSGRNSGTIDVFSAEDSFSQVDEKKVTENNAPDKLDQLGTITIPKVRKGNYILLDVTEYVRPLTVNTAIARPTFVIEQGGDSHNCTFIFDSKENTATSHGPILEIVTGPMFAVVAADGTIDRSSPGVIVNRLDIGNYVVVFPRNVSKGVFTATLGGIDTESQIGFISVARRAVNPNGVFVLTRGPLNSSDADLSFHLTVTSP